MRSASLVHSSSYNLMLLIFCVQRPSGVIYLWTTTAGFANNVPHHKKVVADIVIKRCT